MAIVFITGSTDGLGRAAAHSLLDQGHRVVLHARSADRAAALGELASRAEGVVVGDLQSGAETRSIADQVKAIGRMDTVITTPASIRSGTAARRRRVTLPRWRSTPLRRTC
jgi:NAD(P)-dependent dehydrogenase (short-subunit alcohol dehydrogenase family)